MAYQHDCTRLTVVGGVQITSVMLQHRS